MSDYIEREAAIAVIEEKQKELCPLGMYSRHAVYGLDREKFDAWQEIIDALERIPAADVRPVVLCRDCRYYENDCGWCNYIDQDRDQLDWCSRADTREES